MDNARAARVRTFLFVSLLAVLGFKGDACLCGGSHPRPMPPDTVPTTSASAPTPPASAVP